MPSSEQENAALLNAGGGGGLAVAGKPGASGTAATTPFRFTPPRTLIDWRALHALDVRSVACNNDIDALERVLDMVVGGDIEAEDARNLTPANFIQLFRVAQLTVDYLLHVQDRLSTDSCTAKGELARVQQQSQLLQLKVKELKEELAGSRKEARHLKKSLRTLEAVALSRQQAPAPPPPAPEVRVVERVVEVADPAAARRAERLEGEVEQLRQERQSLQRDNGKLADALADADTASQASIARAVEAARQEEREVAAAKLQAAVEEERKRHSKSKLSVVVSEDSPRLNSKLLAAQQREHEAERRAEAAERELARAAASAAKAAVSPTAEVRRLRSQLEGAQSEADMLRSRLAQRERERERSRSPGRVGLAAELEDADDARVQELEAQLEACEGELAATRAARTRLAARCAQLEQQLLDAQQQQGSSNPGASTAATAAATAAGHAAQVREPQQQVALLQEEKAALKEQCRKLKRRAAQDTAEIEALTQRLLQLSSSSRAASPVKAAASPVPCTAQREGGALEEEQPPARGGIGSPIEESADCPPAASSPPAAQAVRRAGSRPGSACGRRRPCSATGASPASPTRHVASSPSAADQEHFRREMQHTLHNAERPGVVSRFRHSLGSFLALRGDLEGELEAELAAELASYGLDPAGQHLTDSQLAQAMAELEGRRAEARHTMSAGDRQRMDYMRSTAAWHVQRMAELAAGQRVASPVKKQLLTQPPGLRPIRTASRDTELSPSPSPARRGFVEQVLDQVGDEAAVYSPLARGASVLSELGYLQEGDCCTPRSGAASTSQGVAGTPRSPWSGTHSRVLEVEAGRASAPLGHAASQHGSPVLPRAVYSPLAAGSGASSPARQPRAARGMDFGSKQALPAQHVHWGEGEDLVPAQRVGRRPSFTQQSAPGAAALQHGGSRSSSPSKRGQGGSSYERQGGMLWPSGSRRVYRTVQAEGEIVPAASRAAMPDSRDWDTGDAAAVRPAARRVQRL